MKSDRETSIGLTVRSQDNFKKIEVLEWFKDAQDIARFCMAYALLKGTKEGASSKTDTRWSIGNFDRTGEIREIFMILYPGSKTPVRLIEHFVNEGSSLIKEAIEKGLSDPDDLFY